MKICIIIFLFLGVLFAENSYAQAPQIFAINQEEALQVMSTLSVEQRKQLVKEILYSDSIQIKEINESADFTLNQFFVLVAILGGWAGFMRWLSWLGDCEEEG